MKKLLHLMLVLCLAFTFVFALTATAWAETEGIFTYEVKDNAAIITDCDKNAAGTVEIPETLGGYTVKEIGDNAFQGCNSITELTIPDSVVKVGIFWGCENLVTLNIGAGVQLFSATEWEDEYEYWGLYECSALKNINVSENNLAYSDIDGVLFSKDKAELLAYPEGRAGSAYNIPDGTVAINYYAFDACQHLIEINIPQSLTNLDANPFGTCSALKKFIVNQDNPEYIAVDGILFSKDKTVLVAYPAGRPETTYTIPNNVVNIGSGAFSWCSNLMEVNIPESVSTIGKSAFAHCNSLKEIKIPDSVIAINMMTFWSCESLTYVDLGNGVKSIDQAAFARCENLTTVVVPPSTVDIFSGRLDTYNHPFGGCDLEKLSLLVQENSYAQQYAIDDDINYRLGFMVDVSKEHGAVKGGGLCDKFAETTLTATPDEGYKFSGWYAADTLLSADNPYTFTVENDMNITAKFDKVQGGGSSSGGGGGSSSGGGSSAPAPAANSISVPSKTTGGAVSVSPAKAVKGDTVTITTKADDGKKLDKLTVSAGGKELALTDLGGGKYSFTMPDSKVSVEAVFADIKAGAVVFNDVLEGSYYYDAVQWAVEKGITQGAADGTFSPNAACTRAQMVTFLWRAAGSPEPQGTANDFADVSGNAYYAKAVQWAVENGITVGADSNSFSPDSIVSRSQAITFLWRAAGSPVATADVAFGDVSAAAYYNDAVRWAVEKNITTGAAADSFAPVADCSRAEIATFMYRNK